ncbi:restriction modification system DNA specificity subunit [Alteromonas mediterranea MED64]|uniref:restriction endonuclease subunit S n=1 Tax=Alteromonas mediterranea TaxID=314275 RepID=UPI00035572B5|nr:restriction endonuclease subunit S [Alteromonas mediterranea]AGP82748.1 restriction modification system DNA specificity subunit [Alteromonas mediterranea MED64]
MTNKRTVKFGEICREVKISTKDPLADGYDRYIGLEHLDSGSLKIKRWGIIADDNPSFTRVFKKGQILFGRRRAYLKKAAIAEFDGICSGDIIVMEPQSEEGINKLLPFIIQSDKFWAWAVKNSAGGLSPRTKFKSLAEYTVSIPDKVDSAFTLLSKSEATLSALSDLRNSSDSMLYMSLISFAGVNARNLKEFVDSKVNWKLMRVKDCMEICNNARKPISESDRKLIQGNYPYYGPTGVLDHLDHYNFIGQYVLIGEDGDHFLKFKTMPMTQLVSGKFNVNNHAHVLRGTELVTTEWFYFYFLHTWIYKYLTRQGAGRYKLTKDALGAMEIPVPPRNEQEKLNAYFFNATRSKQIVSEKENDSKNLALNLRNELLGV